MGFKPLAWIALAVLLVGLVTSSTGAVAASQDDDDGNPITGEALARASAAALKFTGGGRVTDTEVGDEEGSYEVEVTLDDGRQVDVHLNENFEVIGHETDDETPDDDGPGDDEPNGD
jgi:uncharacterized membrane protein YkoI